MKSPYFVTPCLMLGALCCGLGAVSFVVLHNIFDPVTFGRRAAESLSDPGVAAYAANLVTNRVLARKPDLIAFRPMLLSATESVVASKPFGSVLEKAAAKAHQTLFSEQSQNVLLSLPDLNILVHEAVESANPALAAKIPKSFDTNIGKLAEGKTAALILRLVRFGSRLKWVWLLFLGAALGLDILAIWLASDRGRALGRGGICLIVVGLAVSGVVAGNAVAGIWVHDPGELDLVRGLWRTYLGDLTRWGLLLTGFGVLVAAGASSLLERMDPVEQVSRFARNLASPPSTRNWRILWGAALFVCGCSFIAYPALLVRAAAVVIGVCVAYYGSRELFRLFVESFEAAEESAPDVRSVMRRRSIRIGAVAVLVPALAAAWFFWNKPGVPTLVSADIRACNGFPELCDRRLDQVVFAGAHNAMSNQDAPGWMFPQHEAGMPQMLRDGIRALLIDVHYGFAGGSRIKTDMSTEPTAAKIKQAVGDEGYAAAMRIRDRLVGVDESKRGLYFCHGFCELGAYPVAPALREIRDFVVAHPDEVLLIIIEDTVNPGDLATEFEKAGFGGLIYSGNSSPQWPTLRQFIESGERVIVFAESGRPGVRWIRPAFENFRETPYSFHKVEDFSCRANRGGDAGSLFQVNHWIDTAPTPKPSNAAIVNAYSFLLARAEKCAAERRHLPNLIAVDFYRTGDLFAVVNKLNGVGQTEDAEPNAERSAATEPTR